jgi:hypothetical protein
MTDVLEKGTASIIRVIIEAVSSFKTSVNIYHTTRRNIPEDTHLQTYLLRHISHHTANPFHNVAMYPHKKKQMKSYNALRYNIFQACSLIDTPLHM